MQWEQLSDSQLEAITAKKFPRPLASQIASELYSIPRFIIKDGKIYYGSANTYFVPLTVQQITAGINQFTPFQLMTLREYDVKLYNQVTSSLPKSTFLVNKTRKEYANFAGQPLSLIPLVRKRWPATDQINIVIRPKNYIARGYTDRTVDLLENNLFTQVQIVDTGNDEIKFSEEDRAERTEGEAEKAEREQKAQEIRNQISARLVKRYPNIDAVMQRVKDKKNDLFVDPHFLLPSRYIPQESLMYDPRTKLIWRKELLPNPSDPQGAQMEFFEILADIVDYTK